MGVACVAWVGRQVCVFQMEQGGVKWQWGKGMAVAQCKWEGWGGVEATGIRSGSGEQGV